MGGRKSADSLIVSITKFSEDLGLPQRTLSDYRQIAYKWEGHDVSEETPWPVLTTLADHSSKDDILVKVKEKYGEVTGKNVKDFLKISDQPTQEEIEDEDFFPTINEGCPVVDLTLEEFERVILPSVELWPWFTKGFRPAIVKQLIASDKRDEECCLTKDHILDALTTIHKTLTDYIKEIKKEL